MLKLLKSSGLLLCGIISEEVSDFFKCMFSMFWWVIKAVANAAIFVGARLLVVALIVGLISAVIAAPLAVIAACFVIFMLREVFSRY